MMATIAEDAMHAAASRGLVRVRVYLGDKCWEK